MMILRGIEKDFVKMHKTPPITKQSFHVSFSIYLSPSELLFRYKTHSRLAISRQKKKTRQ